MSGRLNRTLALGAILFFTASDAGAQSVERIEVYRDVAVVTWKTNVDAGRMVPVARSFAEQDGPIVVLTEPADLEVVALDGTRSEWRTDAIQAALADTEEKMAGRTLDLALKTAQLDLVEEDLALLRENRDIGGTAEAILVEDIEEVADWMHGAFREALYRRVELREEVGGLQAELDELERQAAQHAARRVHVHRLKIASPGTVWCQTVEPNAGWSAADAVSFDAGVVTWAQRVAFHLSAPVDGTAQVVFVDGLWAELGTVTMADASPGYERKTKKLRSNRPLRLDAPRYPAPQAVNVSGSTRGEVHLTTFRRDAVAKYHSIPAQWEGVMMTLSVAEGESRVLSSPDVALRLEGEVPRNAGLSARADSLHIEAGQVPDWSVQRDVEPGLCNRSTLGNRIQHRRALVMEVSNRSVTAGTVMLVEPLPRNRALEIEVNPDELDGGVLDEQREQLVWTLTLKAGESRTLRFGYDVSHDREVPTPDWD